MREKIEEIKKRESSPKVIKNLYSKEEIQDFLKLYKDLPTTTHNKKQNVIKKRWLQGYNEKLEKLFYERLKKEIGDFKMDNLKDENGKDIYGLIQESYSPIGTLMLVLIKIKYRQSDSSNPRGQLFLKIDFMKSNHLKNLRKNLSYGQNKRSSEHLKLYGDKPFDKNT